MIAARRDQENLVLGHQHPTKERPESPVSKYPKTPLKFDNDENATVILGERGGVEAIKPGASNKMAMLGTGRRQCLVTPIEPRTRAPLGNKTTNAKAKAIRNTRGKDVLGEIAKLPSAKLPASQKTRKKTANVSPAKALFQPLDREGAEGEEEPEYAPIQPVPLPYQSDVLPQNGLTFEGLKKENLLKGFYQHFYNPLDDQGKSREEKEFGEEMRLVLKKADERNQRETAKLTWNSDDFPESNLCAASKLSQIEVKPDLGKATKRFPHREAIGIGQRKAMQTLGHTLRTEATKKSKIAIGGPHGARLGDSELSRCKISSQGDAGLHLSRLAKSAGEAASRTTIGYSRGRVASSIIRPRERDGMAPKTDQTCKTLRSRDADAKSAVTPPSNRPSTSRPVSNSEQKNSLQFLAIFEDDEEGDLTPICGLHDDSDADKEFEMALTV